MSVRAGLGIDAGGTYAKILAVSGAGRTLGRSRVATLPKRGPRAFVDRVSRAVRALERRMGREAGTACLAIAGEVDAEAGRLRHSPNIRPFEGYPLRGSLSKALRRPVTMHNDANMAAWACFAVELKRRFPNVLTVTLGTGVGGGIVLGGRLHTGSTGSAGEFGHARIRYEGGDPCGCGARGCLESCAGKYGIERLARRLLLERPGLRTPLRAAASKGPLEPERIARAAARGDALAREVWRGFGRALGAGLVSLVYIFNPDAIVLTGGVSRAGALFLPETRRVMRADTWERPFTHVRLKVSERTDLGVLGAALYSLEGPA